MCPTFVFLEVRSQHWMSSSLFIRTQGLTEPPKLTESISLASQSAPRLLLAPPLQCWDYRHILPTLGFLTWILRNQTQILMLAVQTLPQLLSP